MKRTTVITAMSISIGLGSVLAIAQQKSPDELLQNGDFESDLNGWSFVSSSDAKGGMKLVSDRPVSERSPHSLRLEVTELGKSCGIANSGGPAGIKVESDRWYDVTFSARNDTGVGIGLVFSLETSDGKKACARTTLPEIGRGGIGQSIEGNDKWMRYTVSLHAYSSETKCRLLITPIEPATLFIDDVSLQLRK